MSNKKRHELISRMLGKKVPVQLADSTNMLQAAVVQEFFIL